MVFEVGRKYLMLMLSQAGESLEAGGMKPDLLYRDVHHWTPAGHLQVAKGIHGTIYRSVLLDTQSLELGDTGRSGDL